MKKSFSLLFIFAAAVSILGQGLTIRSAFYIPLLKSSTSAPVTPDFTFITNAVAGGDGANATTPARDTTGATATNLFIVWVSTYGNDVTGLLSLTNGVDTGDTFTSLTNVASPGAQRIQGFYFTNIITGTSHTFSATSGGGFPSIAMQCFKVTPGGNVATLDSQSGNLSGSGTSNQPGSRTPSQDKCVVVSANLHNTVAEDMAVSQLGSLIQTNDVSGVSVGLGAAHEIQTSAAARNPTWSWATADITACAMAIFKR